MWSETEYRVFHYCVTSVNKWDLKPIGRLQFVVLTVLSIDCHFEMDQCIPGNSKSGQSIVHFCHMRYHRRIHCRCDLHQFRTALPLRWLGHLQRVDASDHSASERVHADTKMGKWQPSGPTQTNNAVRFCPCAPISASDLGPKCVNPDSARVLPRVPLVRPGPSRQR
jgi:hypothetical protein